MYLWLPILTLLVCWGQGVSAMHLGPFEHVPLRPQHPDAATVQLQNGSALLHAFNATTSTTKSTVTDLVYQIPQQIDATTSLDAKKNPLKKGRRGRIFLSYNYNNNHNESSSSQKYAESHLQQLWQDRMREKRARILVHRHQLLSHLNVSNGTNLKPSSNLINPSVSLNATNHHESPPSADIVELLESIAAANRKRRESRIHTPLSLRPRQRRYCSARDPSTLAFEAPTVFEGKIKSMSSDRRTNFSVTFEITKIHKQQAAYKLPQNVRLQFSYRNFSECDIYREEFRQRGFVRDELEQGKLYFLFVKQINLGNNITILGQPIKKTKRAVNDVLLGVSDNYGESFGITSFKRPVRLHYLNIEKYYNHTFTSYAFLSDNFVFWIKSHFYLPFWNYLHKLLLFEKL